MRSRSVFALVISLCLAMVAPTAANALYEQVNRNVDWYDHPSLSNGVMYKATANGGGVTYNPCDNGWADCEPGLGFSVRISNVLADCATVATGTPCLEAAWIRARGDSTWVQGINHGPLVAQPAYAFAARPALHVGASNPSNRFTFPGITHSGGDSFAINPTLTSDISANGTDSTPVELTTLASAVTINQSAPFAECYVAFGGDGTCYANVSNPPAYEYKIALRLASTPKGWITGRVAAPMYTVETGVSGGAPIRLTIEGAAVDTPGIERNYWYNNLADRSAWDALNSVWNVPWDMPGLGIVSAGPQVGPTHLNEFLQAVAIDSSFDTADQMRSVWRADVGFNTRTMYSCKADSLVGLIASNSMAYASDFPTLNANTFSLDYKIASPHYMPGGAVFNGIYEMRLDPTFAQCIWSTGLNGGTVAFTPGESAVSVVAADGSTKTAITSAGIVDGLISFTASGFTFSQNTIKARLGTGKPPKKTISCLKGTKLKNVTGYSPKCPSGYKPAKKIVCVKGSKSKTVVALAPKCPAGWRKK